MLDETAWTQDRREVWSRIERHVFEPNVPFNFTHRLARDKGWTIEFARAAIAEYRRFCFLAAIGPQQVTPSEEVDEVWHQHLTYSRDYWEIWCEKAIGQKLHHEPTLGGPAENDKFRNQYAATLKRYEDFFGPPPELFWPATHHRFAARPRFRTMDSARCMLLWRPREVWRRLTLTGAL